MMPILQQRYPAPRSPREHARIMAKPENKQLYTELGELVIKELDKDWKYRATNSCCALYKEAWRVKMNPDYHMSSIHYEFNDIPNMVRIAIHNESSGERDLRKLIKESLRNTDIKNEVQ